MTRNQIRTIESNYMATGERIELLRCQAEAEAEAATQARIEQRTKRITETLSSARESLEKLISK